jgi:lactoylglutathione lyase
MIKALEAIEVITIFAEDLDVTRAFYNKVFGREIVYQDDACSVMKLGNIMINMLKAAQAPELVRPAKIASPELGARALFTIKVKDADSVCAELKQLGVRLLNGPIDRPWGRRTAAFADPAGNVWEIAQELPAVQS